MALREHTLHERILENARCAPDAPAFICGDTQLSFREFAVQVERLSKGLRKIGLHPGSRVAVLLDNGIEAMTLYAACVRASLIAVGLNIRTSPDEMVLVLQRTQPGLLIGQEKYAEVLAVLKPMVPECVSLEGVSTERSFTDLLDPDFSAFGEPAPSLNSGCVIIPTAAVAGEPKGALLSQRNLWASCRVHQLHFGLDTLRGHLGIMPLFHVMGLTSAWATFVSGGTTVLLPAFDPATAVAAIDAHKLTYFGSFPPILGRILDAAQASDSRLPSLRAVYGLDGPDNIQRLHQETSAEFWTGFGQAETTAFVTAGRAMDRPGASGRASLMNTVTLVNDLDEPVSNGEAGEIVVRGENVMLEYWGMREETDYAFRNGWHHTGDIGRFDEQGHLHYVKRKAEKELIKTGGENVYPGEVEAVLLRHSDIVACCVIGIADKTWGESVKALCVPKPGASPEIEEVREFVGRQIAGFKKPRIVEFVEDLPLKEGEIDREAVKAQFG